MQKWHVCSVMCHNFRRRFLFSPGCSGASSPAGHSRHLSASNPGVSDRPIHERTNERRYVANREAARGGAFSSALLSAYFAVVLQTRRGEKREASRHVSGPSRGWKAECHVRTWTNLRGCAKKKLAVRRYSSTDPVEVIHAGRAALKIPAFGTKIIKDRGNKARSERGLQAERRK